LRSLYDVNYTSTLIFCVNLRTKTLGLAIIANLLGGRAWRFELFPLVSKELETPNLLRVLRRGVR